MPLPDGCLDSSKCFILSFPDQDKALEEMKRVLKPAGKIMILEIDPNTLGESASNLEILFQHWSQIIPSSTAK